MGLQIRRNKEETIMSGNSGKETRFVQDFEEVSLRIENWFCDLELVQGEREMLTLEASPDLLAKIETTVRGRTLAIGLSASMWEKLGYALSTSLTRARVRLQLEVKSLTALSVLGTARVSASRLGSDVLAIRFQGAGKLQIHQLAARALTVDLGGASRIELAGQATEQKVNLVGAGTYEAGELQSKRATVRLSGMGQASVWVLEDLATEVRGFGSVEVRGKPRVRRAVPALWSLPAAPR
jgi:hypothetical protein